MPLVIKSEDGSERTPHLALTHNELQGGAANQRNVSLLMKSDLANVSEEILKSLEALGVSEVKKAAFYGQMKTVLQHAVREKFKPDEDDWLYVEDFNDSVVIFCNDKGMYSVGYSLVNGEAVIAELANPVTGILSYEPATGNMLLSEDAEDKLEEGVYSLVTKSLQNTTTIEHLTTMFKAQELSKQNEVILLQEEIQKAVAAAEAVLKAQLTAKEQELTKALEEVAKFKEEKVEAVAKARKEAIAAVEKDETAAAELFKSFEAISDEAFEAVMKALKKKEERLDESDLLKELGSKGRVVETPAPEGKDLTAELLKKQFNKEGAK